MENISGENFDKILNSPKPVLLEFYSDSCVPCKRLSPLLAETDENFEDLYTAKINVNFNMDIAGKYNVESTPTIIFFSKGKEVKRMRGIIGKEDLETAVREVLQ